MPVTFTCFTLIHQELVPCVVSYILENVGAFSFEGDELSLCWLVPELQVSVDHPYCVSYCWRSLLPFSVDAGPKITLTLAGLVRSRCAGSTVCLAAERGDVLALLPLEHLFQLVPYVTLMAD